MTLFAAVVAVALIVNGLIETWFSYQEQRSLLTRMQRQQAEAAAEKIGQFVQEIESQMGWLTQLPWSDGTLDEWQFDSVRLMRQVPAITELTRIDALGTRAGPRFAHCSRSRRQRLRLFSGTALRPGDEEQALPRTGLLSEGNPSRT